MTMRALAQILSKIPSRGANRDGGEGFGLGLKHVLNNSRPMAAQA